ncbi:MAG TPA: ATP-binding protein [Xanthobacteraceae bacterium]|nr:ATP-binding protein [Xanthobacteraceae bacterium]
MKQFLPNVIARLRPTDAERADRPMHWLLAATIVLPVAVFLVGAAISYREHEAEAQDRLQRNLSTIYEHGLKVIETVELASRYLDELFDDVTDDEIRRDQAEYHRRLKALADTLPQFADIWIVDAAGRAMVSAAVPAAPQADLSERDYFRVSKNDALGSLYVGEVTESPVANPPGARVFALSRKRTDREGRFAGVIVIFVSPDYFHDYYATLPQPLVASLMRTDGLILARYPEPPAAPPRIGPNSPVLGQLAQGHERGFLTAVSSFDGRERIFAYRKLPHINIFASAGIDRAEIVEAWLTGMSRHLIFGIPATLSMIALCLLALRRTRREAAANRMLRAEITRREATEQALAQAQKMEAVGQLTGGIAHDFNNLLTAIIGNLDLALRRLQGDDRIRTWLSSSRQAADRAATLVQRLLAFSRQHPLEVKSVDVNRLVQGMSELLRRALGETVTIETVLAGGLWKAAIDPNQLESAILNLAVNARDAMPSGGRLTIETANCHLDEHYLEQTGAQIAPGQYVMVAVSDSGSGMTQEVMNRAFDPFFTTKPTGVGTGLGLSQVYGFVKQSGGHIRIYSEVGEGTTIKLYFPRLIGEPAIPAWSAREAALAPSANANGSETVLVVEDDPQVNQLAVEALEERGYQVIAAGDGVSALRTLDARPIDLLLTDVVLPGGMNGRQLSEEVLRQRPGIKVLYVTGYTRNAIIHHGRLDPDIELLTKPFTADALARKVRQILDGAGAEPAARS